MNIESDSVRIGVEDDRCSVEDVWDGKMTSNNIKANVLRGIDEIRQNYVKVGDYRQRKDGRRLFSIKGLLQCRYVRYENVPKWSGRE